MIPNQFLTLGIRSRRNIHRSIYIVTYCFLCACITETGNVGRLEFDSLGKYINLYLLVLCKFFYTNVNKACGCGF